MPLYVNDDEVDALAAELQTLTHARSKKEAVRNALLNEIARTKSAIPLQRRLAPLKEKVRRMGVTDPNFDQKRFTDEMWGDI